MGILSLIPKPPRLDRLYPQTWELDLDPQVLEEAVSEWAWTERPPCWALGALGPPLALERPQVSWGFQGDTGGVTMALDRVLGGRHRQAGAAGPRMNKQHLSAAGWGWGTL